MTSLAAEKPRALLLAQNALKATATLWFLVAVAGQWFFVYYIAALYGGSALSGDFEKWNAITKFGLVAGDLVGNIFFGLHILLASVITFGGPIQLMSPVRNRFPRFHHWNGRIYITTAFVISLGAVYLVLSRGWPSTATLSANLLHAVLIMIFAALTVRHAIARQIDVHRRWALRLFMVVSGVWFFRVMLSTWIALNKGPRWINPETFEGLPITVLNFGCYLIPLALTEIYIRAEANGSTIAKLQTAGGILLLTGLLGFGIVATSLMFWLPLI